MELMEVIKARRSVRKYQEKPVEREKIDACLEAARLAPSACNGQPYHFTVCKGDIAKKVAANVTGMGMNKFAAAAPVMIVISEENYVPTAALGARVKGNDYRSIDIGIAAAYITAEATAQGLGTCILGWLDDARIREICSLEGSVRLVITLGYAKDETLRPKKRKPEDELFGFVE